MSFPLKKKSRDIWKCKFDKKKLKSEFVERSNTIDMVGIYVYVWQ